MGLFDRLRRKEVTKGKIITDIAPFTAWNGNAYTNALYRQGIDAIARNAGKLKGMHVVKSNGNTKDFTDSRLNRMLQVQPNPYMTAYNFLYKLVTHYYLFNNSFAYIERDRSGNILALYPITATQANFLADEQGNLFVEFRFRNGKTFVFAYRDLIHISRFFNSDELLGDSNDAVAPALTLAQTMDEGIVNGIKSNANIRGILKYTQIMNEDKLKESSKKFVEEYLDISNNGGVVATDSKMEYVPIEAKPQTIDAEQLKTVQGKIYSYLGITEKIVTSSYTEDEWSSFYESVIEPLALQLSLEFTRKIFNDRERAFGNSIVFDSGRLVYSSNATKLNIIKELAPMGLLTLNQCMEILNLPPVEDGDKRIVSLNYIDKAIANAYQLANAGATDTGNTNEGQTA